MDKKIKVVYEYSHYMESCECCSYSVIILFFYDTEGKYWKDYTGEICENAQDVLNALDDPEGLKYIVDIEASRFY